MRDATVPSDHQEFIVRENIPDDVGIRKDRAEHQRPGDDAAALHGVRGKHVLAAEDRFSDQCAGDAMGDRVHRSSLSDAL